MLTSASKLIAEPRTRSDGARRTLPRAVFLRWLAAWELLADFLTCMTLILAAQWLQSWLGRSPGFPLHKAVAASVFIALLNKVILERDSALIINPVRETAAAVRACVQTFALLVSAAYLLHAELPYASICFALLLTPAALMLQRRLSAPVLRILNQHGYATENVVIYGASSAGLHIASAFYTLPHLALVAVAIIDEDPRSVEECRLDIAFRSASPVSVQCAPVTPGLLQSLHCDILVIAATELSAERRSRLEAAAAETGCRIANLSDASPDGLPSRQVLDVGDLLLEQKTTTSVHVLYRWGKRLIDLFGAGLLLILLCPFLLLIAVLIRITSPGPALFVQKRVGLNGLLFAMYKFRSMSCGARPYERSPKTSHDPRITAVGRFLRRTSMDELPQLINVLLGHMSLVGPRPEMPFITNHYDARQRQRLQVVPGITGLWQLSSDRLYPIHENLHHDLSYIRHRCLSLDLAILLHTLFFAMRGGV